MKKATFKKLKIALVTVVCIVTLALVVRKFTGRGKNEGFLGAAPPQTIFVSVAAYRDSDCSDTIRDIFTKAEHPERVIVGICEQNTEDSTEDCLPPSLKQYKKQVRRITIPNTEAKGPTYGRALIANVLYGGEDFFMQIDSHSKFCPKWDTISIGEHAACPNPAKNILSHYPRSWTEYDEACKPDSGVPVLCKTRLDPGTGIPNLEAVILKPGSKPRRVPFVSGGYVFGPGRMVKDVPYDPTLDYVFIGEELLHAARLFTAGYDIYTPRKNVLTHFYGRQDKPKFWTDLASMKSKQEESTRKVRRLLGFEQPPVEGYEWGFGTVRTLDEYYKFSHIDPIAKTTDSAASFCSWQI